MVLERARVFLFPHVVTLGTRKPFVSSGVWHVVVRRKLHRRFGKPCSFCYHGKGIDYEDEAASFSDVLAHFSHTTRSDSSFLH
jgi:hypothetical protein